eukprot:5935515-Amphidinium_carterae.1
MTSATGWPDPCGVGCGARTPQFANFNLSSQTRLRCPCSTNRNSRKSLAYTVTRKFKENLWGCLTKFSHETLTQHTRSDQHQSSGSTLGSVSLRNFSNLAFLSRAQPCTKGNKTYQRVDIRSCSLPHSTCHGHRASD